jgi:hypothetical protein
LKNKSTGTSKEVLASWVLTALEKALTKMNVKNGFRTTGIFLFNPCAMDGKMGPSEFYIGGLRTLEEEVAVGAPVDLGASKNLWEINQESYQEGVQHGCQNGRFSVKMIVWTSISSVRPLSSSRRPRLPTFIPRTQFYQLMGFYHVRADVAPFRVDA